MLNCGQLLFATGLLGCSAASFGQAGTTTVAAPPVMASSEPAGRVYLDVVVSAKDGPPVAGLSQQDFSIVDNKISQPIASFLPPGSTALVQTVLLVDVLNSQEVTLAKVRPELDKFLLSNDGKMAYPTTLAVLTENGIHLQSAGSQEGKGLSAALDRYLPKQYANQLIPGFHGGEERVQKSLMALSGLVTKLQKQHGRKIVLWVSPGWPVFGGPGMYLDAKQQQQVYKQIVAMSDLLRKARVTLYCIDPLGSSESVFQSQAYRQYLKPASKPSQADAGDLSLQVLATQDGGLVLGSSGDVAGLLRTAIEDAKASYQIGVDPKPGEALDEYHPLQVKVARPGLMARTRAGYYAQP